MAGSACLNVALHRDIHHESLVLSSFDEEINARNAWPASHLVFLRKEPARL
jgi:hypothetical protein